MATPRTCPEPESGFGVGGVKNVFDGDDLGMVRVNQGGEFLEDAEQADFQRIAGREPDDAHGDAMQLAAFLLHDGKAGILAAAINAHDSHVG